MSVVTNCRDLPGIQCPQDEDSAPLEYFGAVSILAIIGNFRRRAHGRANNCDESNHVDLGDHHYRKLWRRRGEQEYGPSLLTPDGRKGYRHKQTKLSVVRGRTSNSLLTDRLENSRCADTFCPVGSTRVLGSGLPGDRSRGSPSGDLAGDPTNCCCKRPNNKLGHEPKCGIGVALDDERLEKHRDRTERTHTD